MLLQNSCSIFHQASASLSRSVRISISHRNALAAASDIGVWHCVKQEGMKPDLNAVTGDNPGIEPGGHDKWE